MKSKSSFNKKAGTKKQIVPKTKGLGKTVVKARKKEIVEYYYMTPQKTDAKDISLCIEGVPQEKIEVWRELNLMEVVLAADSLIFQDARECFEDPLDLDYIKAHGIETIYQISYDKDDEAQALEVMREVLEKKGGRVYSGTDDFEPSWGAETILSLITGGTE